MDLSIGKYNLTNDFPTKIQVSVSNPTQVKTALSSYTTYKIKGVDKKGEFECTRRYSQFDFVRQVFLKRWPGCYIPALPQKKLVGNNDLNFIENRRYGLDLFCQQMAQLPHLWYSEEFEIFIHKAGDVQANLKGLPNESHEDIIKKYDDKLTNLRGKSIDTNLISKVLQFNKYLKRVQPLQAHLKQFLVLFTEVKNANNDQYSVLFNYVLPEYERTCLANYLDQNTSGKLIFSDEHDERLASFISGLKQMIAKHNFDQILHQIEHQEREVNAFLDVYKQHATYEKKVAQLKEKQKQLQSQQQQLSMGKQGLFKSLMKKNINDSKNDIEREININKDLITTYTLLSDLITMILGFFEIDRFRELKWKNHQKTITQVARIQVEIARLQKDIYNHILDNHNLI